MMMIFFLIEFALVVIVFNVVIFLGTHITLIILFFFIASISLFIITTTIKKIEQHRLIKHTYYTISYPLSDVIYPLSFKSLCGELIYIFYDPIRKKLRYIPKRFVSFKEGRTLYPYHELHEINDSPFSIISIHSAHLALIKDRHEKLYIVNIRQLSIIS